LQFNLITTRVFPIKMILIFAEKVIYCPTLNLKKEYHFLDQLFFKDDQFLPKVAIFSA